MRILLSIFAIMLYCGVYGQDVEHDNKSQVYHNTLGTFEVHIENSRRFSLNFEMIEEIVDKRLEDEDVLWQVSDDLAILIYSETKISSSEFVKSEELILIER